MNKEKVLQLVSEAIDKGAVIDIHILQFEGMYTKRTKEEAESYIKRAEEALGGGQIERGKSEFADSVGIRKGDFRILFSHAPVMEEDVLLGGDTDGTPLGTSDDRAC